MSTLKSSPTSANPPGSTFVSPKLSAHNVASKSSMPKVALVLAASLRGRSVQHIHVEELLISLLSEPQIMKMLLTTGSLRLPLAKSWVLNQERPTKITATLSLSAEELSDEQWRAVKKTASL